MKEENLPFKESRKENLTRRFGNLWNLFKFEYPRRSDKSQYPWVIADRLIRSNIGRNVDKVFSKFCKITTQPWSAKEDFYKEIYGIGPNKWGLRRKIEFCEFILDKQNRIQYNKLYKKRSKRNHLIYFSDEYYLRPGGEYTTITFKSRHDPKFVQLRVEQQKRLSYGKRKPMSDEEFRYWLNYNKMQEERTSHIKLEAKGFDPKTSFRNH